EEPARLPAATPQEAAAAAVKRGSLIRYTTSHVFPAATPIAIETRVSSSNGHHGANSNGALPFESQAALHDTALLDLFPAAGIDRPAKVADVLVIAPWVEAQPPAAPAASQLDDASQVDPAAENIVEQGLAVMEAPSSPRESLQALSRLHEEMVEFER